jgi:predicted MFS family arabinose efflux permease
MVTVALERAVRPPLVSRPLLVRFVSVAGVSVSFYIVLSVVPLFVRAVGASTNVAGLTTTVLSLSTIAGYLPTPRLVARYGHRVMLAAGMLLLGAPALVLAGASGLTIVMLACVVRGIGFAICCVSGAALTVSLIPPERRGEGLALIGVVSGVPALVALPAGVWLAGHIGFRAVFFIAAAAALAPLVSLPWLPNGGRTSRPTGARTIRPTGGRTGRRLAEGGSGVASGSGTGSGSMLAGLRTPAVVRPALVFFAAAMGTGIFATFVPLAASRADAALALLIQAAAAMGGRWFAGRFGDRTGAGLTETGQTGTGQTGAGRTGAVLARRRGLLVPGVLIAAAGMALLSVPGHAAPLLLAGALLFGAGFGIAQNASLTRMYDVVTEPEFSMVGAVWNLAYDSGMGIGAAWFGVLAGDTGYPAAFGAVALVMVAATTLNRGTKTP